MRWGDTDILVGVPAGLGWQNKPRHPHRTATLTPQGDGAAFRTEEDARAWHTKRQQRARRNLNEDVAMEVKVDKRRRSDRIARIAKQDAKRFLQAVSGEGS